MFGLFFFTEDYFYILTHNNFIGNYNLISCHLTHFTEVAGKIKKGAMH